MQIVWDPKQNKYVNKDAGENDADDAAKDLPPPTDSEVQQKHMPPTLPSTASGANVARTYNRQKVRGKIIFAGIVNDTLSHSRTAFGIKAVILVVQL
jgi:hypothetical protein